MFITIINIGYSSSSQTILLGPARSIPNCFTSSFKFVCEAADLKNGRSFISVSMAKNFVPKPSMGSYIVLQNIGPIRVANTCTGVSAKLTNEYGKATGVPG